MPVSNKKDTRLGVFLLLRETLRLLCFSTVPNGYEKHSVLETTSSQSPLSSILLTAKLHLLSCSSSIPTQRTSFCLMLGALQSKTYRSFATASTNAFALQKGSQSCYLFQIKKTPVWVSFLFGADDGNRTREPHPYQGCALPTELHQHQA